MKDIHRYRPWDPSNFIPGTNTPTVIHVPGKHIDLTITVAREIAGKCHLRGTLLNGMKVMTLASNHQG